MANFNEQTHLRTATVVEDTDTANLGDCYIVLRLDFNAGVAYCFGEILKTEGDLIKKAGPPKVLPLTCIAVRNNVRRDSHLLGSLFRQAVRNAKSDYEIKTTRAGNVYATLVQ